MPTDIYARLRDLAASAEAKPGEMRPVLLRVTTDLFSLHARHTPEEIRLYEEMAGKLIDSADEATLAIVARKLARCSDAPAALLSRIRARGGEGEREVLRADAHVDWRDLRHIAASGPCHLASAVAQRGDLDREITSLLAARPEREVARALAANPLAPMTAESTRALALRGRDDPLLARALLDRSAPRLELLPLFLIADARERSRLIALALEAGLAEFGAAQAGARLDEAAAARIEDAAALGKKSTLALLLADLLNCDSLCARRIVEDEGGEALALAFLAVGLPKETAARILPVALPRLAWSPDAFNRIIGLFDSLSQRVAVRIVEAMTGSPRGARDAVGRKGPKVRETTLPRAQARETGAAPAQQERFGRTAQGDRR